ncbi:cysteine--tRNA ligase [Candidatus Shikimatogenerans bostrichidophilus]|uniref:cysteine--tRNA ligase n=1 Tax=Candidatus Shikimatogenerans bostrichidophilus TaxID=2943807 RepID=UPI00296713BC
MKNIKNYAKNNIFIYNSLTNKKEKFIPIEYNKIGMYVCGPTIYNNIHLGNLRTFIFFDILYRYLKHLNFKVKYIRNITDITHLEFKFNLGNKPMEIIQKYLLNFYFILNKFNILSPNIEPRSTGHIIEQIINIKNILKKKFAYINKGSIYFDINYYNKIFGNYGNILNNIDINKEVNLNNKFLEEKKNYYDFAIWKKSNSGMNWESPWGKGNPGWHIGCSTMSNKYLGNYFDIHGGGIDLKFPHHECEITQSNIINNNHYNLAKYWIHTNLLTINNKKMSKSLNNFIIPNDIINGKLKITNYKKINPIIVRLYFLQTHYRKIINISNKSLINTEKNYKILFNILNNIKKIKPNLKTSSEININNIYKIFYLSINEDFNIPLLIYNLFKINKIIEKCINKKLNINLKDIKLLYSLIKIFLIDILGLKFKKKNKSINYNKIINKIYDIRNEMRKNKLYYYSDKLRNILNNYLNIKDNKI